MSFAVRQSLLSHSYCPFLTFSNFPVPFFSCKSSVFQHSLCIASGSYSSSLLHLSVPQLAPPPKDFHVPSWQQHRTWRSGQVSRMPLLLAFVQVTALLNTASRWSACFIAVKYGSNPLAVGAGTANQPALSGEGPDIAKAASSLLPSMHTPCMTSTGNSHYTATGKCLHWLEWGIKIRQRKGRRNHRWP